VFEDITAESIKQNILNAMQTDIDKREGSYTSDMVAPVATELWKVYTAMNALLPIAFVDETSGEYIDKRAAEVGITRKAGTKAHAELTLTGTAGTVVPAGTVFLTPDGLEYETDADAVLDSSETAVVTANAAEVGEAYNVPAGSITNQYNSLAGLSSVTNQAAAVGGTDPETDESLVNRYYSYLQKPATSGNAHHYEQWALEVDGVGDAKIFPLWNGPGTVKVLIVDSNKQSASNEIIQSAAEHIEKVRPIGANVTVESATELSINVNAKINLAHGYSIQNVQSAFAHILEEYRKSIVFKNSYVSYAYVGKLLFDTDGVLDYSDLTLNSAMQNVSIEAEEIPVFSVELEVM
jgi:uncharacterized phage protein gp47/JayE